MPTKKGSKGKKAAPPLPVETPPLPDEQPPLPDQAPPLSDEQPPLPTEQPPLPTEQPPLPTEQPPLPTEQPPLPTEQPPLPIETPPLPTETPPLPVETEAPAAEPITSLGEGSDDEGNEEEDEEDSDADDDEEGGSGEEGSWSKSKSKGKGKEHDWQAVWAPANNAYYFWNSSTGEVTWTNPLANPDAPPLPNEPPPLPSGPPPSSLPSSTLSGLPEIDPALALLLPAEQRDAASSSTSAAFAARTGRLGTDSHYAFAALDEYSRQKRFNEHYFDVDGWEKAKAAEARKRRAEEEAGVARDRKITKKDMDRFRAKKAEQKHRKQAWLYD